MQNQLVAILFSALLVVTLYSIFWKSSFFVILVLVEVALILTSYSLLICFLPPWYLLPILGIGACESSLGLGVSVWLSRSHTISSFSL